MMTIRPLQPDDLTRGFLETLSNLQPTNIAPEDALQLFHNLPECVRIYVAVEDDGNVVGAATLFVENKFLHGGSKAGHVEDVATHKDHQGKGIGSLLQKHLIEEAKRLGCYKIMLDCKNNLIPFYNKFGYQVSDNHMRLNLK
jgi:glucosamine-phosphate N-acetyltransferase